MFCCQGEFAITRAAVCTKAARTITGPRRTKPRDGRRLVDLEAHCDYTLCVKVIWDRHKNQVNIEKHGLDFTDAFKVFQSPMLAGLDDREEYPEERWIGIGLMDNRTVVLVFSEPAEETVRIISFRKATTDERKRYEQAYKNQFGSL